MWSSGDTLNVCVYGAHNTHSCVFLLVFVSASASVQSCVNVHYGQSRPSWSVYVCVCVWHVTESFEGQYPSVKVTIVACCVFPFPFFCLVSQNGLPLLLPPHPSLIQWVKGEFWSSNININQHREPKMATPHPVCLLSLHLCTTASVFYFTIQLCVLFLLNNRRWFECGEIADLAFIALAITLVYSNITGKVQMYCVACSVGSLWVLNIVEYWILFAS